MDIFLVGLGGGLGAMVRYLVNRLLMEPAAAAKFPLSTLAVNIVGCFVIGVLAHVGESRLGLSPQARLFLMTGILGGFTTFSAFGNETVLLARGDQMAAAIANVALHLVLGLMAVWVGRAVAAVVVR